MSTVGEEKAKPRKRLTEDTEIASSIRNAMSHLRAGSLPAALVRPPQPDAEDSDPQASPSSPLISYHLYIL